MYYPGYDFLGSLFPYQEHITDPEHIGKGFINLSASVRDELLAMSEKTDDLNAPPIDANIFPSKPSKRPPSAPSDSRKS